MKVQKTHVCLLGFVVTSIHAIWSPFGFWPAWRVRRANSRWAAPKHSALPASSMSFFISGRSITCPAPSALLSLRQSFENLKPDGYLALETQVYDHPQDPNICYFMHMQNNDPTNFWALRGLEEKFRTDWILRRARSEKNRPVDAGRTHEPNNGCRPQTCTVTA